MPPAAGHTLVVRHARADALDLLEPLLAQLRNLPLNERSRGVFYRGSKAFLHFHDDPAGLFADVRLDGVDFVRMDVSSPAQQSGLLDVVARALVVN